METGPDARPTLYSDHRPAYKPLPPVARIGLLVLGTLALGLGVVGLLLPVLPTTPFVLIALGCYVRSSERLYNWLRRHPRLGPSVRRYVETKALPLRVKIVSLVVAWAALGATALWLVDRLWVKGLLIAVALAKTVFMVRVPTLRQEEQA